MKSAIAAAVFSTFALLGCSEAPPSATDLPQRAATSKRASPNQTGTVYFFGFDVPRVTGIPEHEMEKFGCKFKITEPDLIAAMASPQPPHVPDYNALDVRAKISFPKETYYIDHQGVLYKQGRPLLIDKAKFNDALMEPEPCS